MLGSTILETAIGLVFVYLLFSLLISAINEAVMGHLTHLRSRVLENGLKALLSDEGNKAPPAGQWFKTLWAMLSAPVRLFMPNRAPNIGGAQNFAEHLLEHPLVKGLAPPGTTCPSYLPANTFADAVVGLLAVPEPTMLLNPAPAVGAPPPVSFQDVTSTHLVMTIANLKDPHAKKLLSSVLAGTRTIQEARQRLAAWFNESMDRVSGAYKRRVQLWLYIWATLLVLCLNIDTIDLARRLLADTQFRTVLVNSATDFATKTNLAEFTVGQSNKVAMLQSDITKLKLPLGWGLSTINEISNSIPAWALTHFPIRLQWHEWETNSSPNLLVSGLLTSTVSTPTTPEDWWLKLLGLIITIGAISQGAPFWFDILNKVTNLRAAGQPPKVEKPPTA
jgi:hypothetical protein